MTTIRLPETITSVVVGDAASFLVEHSEREPKLVFVKPLTVKPAETNLLIATSSGHQVSLLLVNRGDSPAPEGGQVAFLIKYAPAAGFMVEPVGFPISLIGQTISLQGPAVGPTKAQLLAKGQESEQTASSSKLRPGLTDGVTPGISRETGLDELLEQQERSVLPRLYGGRITEESEQGELVRAGVSRVIDRCQDVVVLFSVVNSSKRPILLMPPQVQVGGKVHNRWAKAEQLPVMDFRLNRRRLGPGERADGVVLFERPPYKQSNETLLLQIAESGAVDRPALVPIGFGISTQPEE